MREKTENKLMQMLDHSAFPSAMAADQRKFQKKRKAQGSTDSRSKTLNLGVHAHAPRIP